MPDIRTEMTADDVFWMVKLLEQNQIEVTLDGGWGVDALLGEQTRKHSDLDIVIAYADSPRLKTVLETHGFKDVPRPDTRPINYVLGDEFGHLVDIHTYTLDRENHPEHGLDYPLESLNGKGTILGYPVRCIDVKNMVEFHSGYDLDENDYHDVKVLCQRFGIDLPAVFTKFEK